jgi:hypothetical protein
VSGAVFLDPSAATQVAAELRRAARTVTTGGVCSALALPGDDGGLAAAVATLLLAEGQAASHLAGETDRFATELEGVVAAALGVDRFGPR